MRLLAARARGGDAASVRELARLQERERLAREAREGIDSLEEIWGQERWDGDRAAAG
jgi:hypothetical protein